MRSLAALVVSVLGAGCGFEAPNLSANGEPVTVGFLASASLQDEASGTIGIPVALNTPSAELVSVRYRFAESSATNGVDYTGSDNVLTIPPGATEAKIPLTINMDGIEENAEQIRIVLSDETNALLGISEHTVTISRDILPRVRFEAGSSSADEATSPVLRVSLDTPSPIQVSVDYVVSGTATSADFQLPAGMLTFPPGTTTKDLAVPVTDDTLDEFDENLLVTLTNSTNVVVGTTASHDHNIVDNDLEPTVSFMVASQSKAENGIKVDVVVKLSAASGKTVKVDVAQGAAPTIAATLADDFVFVPTTLTFNPGTTQLTVSALIVDDQTDEFDEDFTLALAVQSGYNVQLGATTTETVTITDNDNQPTVAFQTDNVVTNEGDTGTKDVVFTVELSRASAKPITVPITLSGSADDPADYSVVGNPIQIAAGQTTGTITIRVVGDTTRENQSLVDIETVSLAIPTNGLVNVSRGGQDTTKTLSIKDDD